MYNGAERLFIYIISFFHYLRSIIHIHINKYKNTGQSNKYFKTQKKMTIKSVTQTQNAKIFSNYT